MADFLQLFTAEYNSIRENLLNEIDLSVNNAVNHIINIYKKSSANMHDRYLARNSVNNKQPWWDRECETTKQLKYAALRHFRWTNNTLDLQQFVALRKHLKKNVLYIKVSLPKV
jgi:hypothetical protein